MTSYWNNTDTLLIILISLPYSQIKCTNPITENGYLFSKTLVSKRYLFSSKMVSIWYLIDTKTILDTCYAPWCMVFYALYSLHCFFVLYYIYCRPTDIVTYRAAIAAKNLSKWYISGENDTKHKTSWGWAVPSSG